MPDLVSAGVGSAIGVAQTVAGLVNAAKTKKLAKELELSRPKYQISDLAGEDLALAESELANGMSSRAESAYNNLNNQQFSSSLSAILRGGGSVNNVAETYGASEEGRLRLAQLQDQLRLSQIDRVMKTRQMYRDEQDKEWQINDFAPWEDKKVANAEARAKAQDQIWGGIGTVANAGINYFGGKNQEKMYDKYFGKPTMSSSSSMMRSNPVSGLRPNMLEINSSNPFTKWDAPDYNFNPDSGDDILTGDYLMDESTIKGDYFNNY
jgi:hypothetical protein